MAGLTYPVPIWLPRRRRIVSPAEWLREREREREQTISRAIAFDATLGTTSNNISLTTTTAAAADTLIVFAAWWFGTQTMDATFTAAGLSWTRAIQGRGTTAGDQNIALAWASAPSGLATGTYSFSDAYSATPDFGPGQAAVSFTGMDVSSPVDVTAAFAEDFNETWVSSNLVTTNADDLLFAISVADTTLAHTATSPATEAFGEFTAEGTQRLAGVYRIVTSTGTYTLGGVWGTSVAFQHSIGVALKQASGAPPPAGPKLRLHMPALRLR